MYSRFLMLLCVRFSLIPSRTVDVCLCRYNESLRIYYCCIRIAWHSLARTCTHRSKNIIFLNSMHVPGSLAPYFTGNSIVCRQFCFFGRLVFFLFRFMPFQQFFWFGSDDCCCCCDHISCTDVNHSPNNQIKIVWLINLHPQKYYYSVDTRQSLIHLLNNSTALLADIVVCAWIIPHANSVYCQPAIAKAMTWA